MKKESWLAKIGKWFLLLCFKQLYVIILKKKEITWSAMQRFYDHESSTLCYFLINNIGKITQCVDLYKSSGAHGTNAWEDKITIIMFLPSFDSIETWKPKFLFSHYGKLTTKQYQSLLKTIYTIMELLKKEI